MKVRILGIKREDGRVVPDPDHVVADLELDKEAQQVNLDVHDRAYEKPLRELFSGPRSRFTAGLATPDGNFIDGGAKSVQPWDPEVLKEVGNEMFAMGLRYVVVDETKQ